MVGDSSPPSVASKMSSRSASRSRAKATSTGSPCDLRRATRSTSPRDTTSLLPPRSQKPGVICASRGRRPATPSGGGDGRGGRRCRDGGRAGIARPAHRACGRPRRRPTRGPGVGRGTRPRRDAASSPPSPWPSPRRRAPARGRAGPPRSPTAAGKRSPTRPRSWRAPRSRRRRGSRTVPTASGSRSSATLREEPLDHRLGLLVVALADVPVPDDPLTVHEDERGPGPDAEPLPDAEVVVLDDRVSHTESPRRVRDLLVRLLPEELGAVDADDGQPEGLKPLVPRPQLRDHVAAVDSAVGPELDEDHTAAQPLRRQGPTVDPPLPRDVGRGVADPRCLAGCEHAPERSERDEQHDDDEPGTAHGYSFFSIVLSSCVIILSPSTPPWSRSSSRTSAAIVGVAAGRLVNTV